MMAHAQKRDFVFRGNGCVHLYRRGRQFSGLLAAEVCASAVVMLDTPFSEVVWRVLATHSIRQFPPHFPSLASPCAITFQLDFITKRIENIKHFVYHVASVCTVRMFSPVTKKPCACSHIAFLGESISWSVDSYYYRYSALGPFWAETRAQSGDWYGSGTLHPGQVLRGSLPLLSPRLDVPTFATRCLHVRHDARDPSGGRWNCGRECCPVILSKWRLPCHLGIFYMPKKSTTWDRRLYFPSEGRRAEDFFRP